jgi:polyisoprenoid-binding protein YceI
MKRIAPACLLAVVVLSACDSNPTKGKALANTSAPAPAVPVPAGATAFAFSQAGSTIDLTGAKVTGKHDISVKEFSGTIHLVDADPTKSAVQVELVMGTIYSEPPKFLKHLKSPDFLDVERFPSATFESTSIAAGGSGGTHTITGNLTLHGQKKAISFPATIVVSGDHVSAKAEFGINRQDFGITSPGQPDDLIKDEVLVRLNIDGHKG